MSSLTKTWLREQSLRGYTPKSHAQARVSACQTVTRHLTGFLHPPAPRATAVDQRVLAVLPETKASKHLTSRLGPNPLSPGSKEEVLNGVACQESTQTKDFTLKAKKTKAKPTRCCAVLDQGARSSVSRAFVHTRWVETKKGGA